MDLCSLQQVIAASKYLEWPPKDASLRLELVQNVPFDLLRELESLGVLNVESISHPDEPAVHNDFSKGESGVFKPRTELKLKLPRIVNEAVVATDLSDLLTISSTSCKHPKTYLLLSEGKPPQQFCYLNEDSLKRAPPSVVNYHAAIDLWNLLKKQAIYATDTQELVFYRLRRLEIYPGFTVGDLNDKLPASLKEIKDFIGDADENKTQSEIFRSVLLEFLRDVAPEKAYGYLLARSEYFVLRLNEGLAIYLSDNSPEKLAKQAVAKHFEFAEKLEKVIGGMEARSLTIPVAVLFAVKEMKTGEGLITSNGLILISTLLYLIAMIVGYISQREILGLLKRTIDKAKKDLFDQGLKENEPVLTESFTSLIKRLRNTTYASRIMVVVSAVPLIAAFYIGFVASPPPEPPTKWPEMRIIPASANILPDPKNEVATSFETSISNDAALGV